MWSSPISAPACASCSAVLRARSRFDAYQTAPLGSSFAWWRNSASLLTSQSMSDWP